MNTWNSKVGERAPERISQVVAKALATNKRLELEESCGNKTFSLMFAPIILEGYVNIYSNDITERKKTEEALKESEEKFRNLAEESPNVIFINKRGRVIYANKKCEDITGYSREELYSPNFNFFSLCAPEYIEEMKASYATHMRGEEAPPYDYVLIAKSGERIDVKTTSKLINYDEDRAILGIVTTFLNSRKQRKVWKKNNGNSIELSILLQL